MRQITSRKTAQEQLRRRRPEIRRWSQALIDEFTENEENRKIIVEAWGGNLEYIPSKYIDAELCARAIMKGGSGERVPNDMWTEKMAHAAVSYDIYAIRHIPERFKTLEFCSAWVLADPQIIIAYGFPVEHREKIAIWGAKSFATGPLAEAQKQPFEWRKCVKAAMSAAEYEAYIKEIAS